MSVFGPISAWSNSPPPLRGLRGGVAATSIRWREEHSLTEEGKVALLYRATARKYGEEDHIRRYSRDLPSYASETKRAVYIFSCRAFQPLLHRHLDWTAFVLEHDDQEFCRLGFACVPPHDMNIVGPFIERLARR